ncbi:MAG TPA: hypothetical protein VG186_10820 [Solirubrobacteraceae bacterium]|jgi:hypothetical protein|nr:hypothetical protein [Solirubrobacteraceae bacterium]
MSTFTVDPITLESLQHTISGLYVELSSMHRVAPSFGGVIGGSDLEGELRNFLGAWQTGVSLIEGDMQRVAQRLGEACAAYGQSETYISAACGG